MATVLKAVSYKWNSRSIVSSGRTKFSSGANLLTDAIAGFSFSTSEDSSYLTGKGTGYLHVTVPGNETDSSGVILVNPGNPITVTPGMEYTYSVYIGSENYDPQISLRVTWKDANGNNPIVSTTAPQSVLSDFERIYFTTSCPTGSSKAELSLIYNNVYGRPAFRVTSEATTFSAPTQDIKIRILGGSGIIDPHDIRVNYNGDTYTPLILDVYQIQFEEGSSATPNDGYSSTGGFSWQNKSLSRSSKSLQWGNIGVVRKPSTLTWKIQNPSVVRLSMLAKWNDNSKTSNSGIFVWKDSGKALSSRTFKWTDCQTLFVSKDIGWRNLTSAGTSKETLRWNVFSSAFASKSVNLSWSDRKISKKSNSFKWSSSRVVPTSFKSFVWKDYSRTGPKTVSLKWSLKSNSRKSQSYYWNSSGFSKKSVGLNWNDNAFSRKTESYVWNDLTKARVSKTLNYKNRQLVRNSRRLNWSVTGSAGVKYTTLSWNDLGKASKPTGLRWADLQKSGVSSKVLRWNSTRSVASTTRLRWKFKGRMGYGVKVKPFERVTVSASSYRRIR